MLDTNSLDILGQVGDQHCLTPHPSSQNLPQKKSTQFKWAFQVSQKSPTYGSTSLATPQPDKPNATELYHSTLFLPQANLWTKFQFLDSVLKQFTCTCRYIHVYTVCMLKKSTHPTSTVHVQWTDEMTLWIAWLKIRPTSQCKCSPKVPIIHNQYIMGQSYILCIKVYGGSTLHVHVGMGQVQNGHLHVCLRYGCSSVTDHHSKVRQSSCR